MNPTLEKQMRAADAAMDAHGETQPNDVDGRAATSAANGAKGGRPQVDYLELARAYQMDTGIVRWCDEYFQYDQERGAYRRLTERKMGASVGGWMKGAGDGVRYTMNAETNIVRALRAGFDRNLSPPCFTDTGRSAAGWIAMRNGLLDVEAAARGEPSPLAAYTTAFFSTAFLPYDWNPAAPCPRFMRFIEEVLPDVGAREMARMLTLIPDF